MVARYKIGGNARVHPYIAFFSQYFIDQIRYVIVLIVYFMVPSYHSAKGQMSLFYLALYF